MVQGRKLTSNVGDVKEPLPFYPYTLEIFKNVFDFYGTLDSDGRVVSLNGTIFEQTKADPELLIGQAFSETVFWQSSDTTPPIVEDAIKQVVSGEPTRILVDFRVSADKKVAVEMFLQPLKVDGRPDVIFFSGQQVAERESRVDHFRAELDELISAADSAEVGLWFWDLHGEKMYTTPKCNEMLGLPAYDELTYEKFFNAVHQDDRDRIEHSFRTAYQKGTKFKEEFRVLYPDGRVEWISAEGKSFLDENGQPLKVTAAVRKITEQKLAEEELTKVYDREKKARDEAVEANRAKDFFLAFVSHELRSPLNAILGWAKILLTKPVDDETRRNALETIERSARSQTKLINDLVDSARVASGKISLEFRPTNLYEVVKVSFHAQKPAADGRNIQFEFMFSDEDVIVFGDANRLQQVFGNLISNAVKFTAEGGRIAVELTKQDTTAQVRVSDTGRGISPESLPTIFKQFSQGDIDKDLSRSGLGLGLSIVNILIAKHGGTVVAESGGLGKGTTFIVTLPLKAIDRMAFEASVEASLPDSQPLRGTRILVVEDDNDSREVLQLFLEQAGAIVSSASSAAAAMLILDASHADLPDIIVSDLAMPDEDGYSMISRIRSLPTDRGGRIPALALSAFATNESKQRALEAGFDSYCTKPFEPDQLTRDVLNLRDMRSHEIETV